MSNTLEFVYPDKLTSDHLGRIVSFVHEGRWYVGRLKQFMMSKNEELEKIFVYVTVRTTEREYSYVGSLGDLVEITIYPTA